MLSKLKPLAALFLCVGALLFLMDNYRLLSKSPFSFSFNLDNPVFMCEGADGNYYVIDKSYLRVSAITPQGRVKNEIWGGRPDGFYYARQLGVDRDSRIFIDNYINDLRDKSLEIEELIKIGSDGGKKRSYFSDTHNWSDYGKARVLAMFASGTASGAWFYDNGEFVKKVLDASKDSLIEKERFSIRDFDASEAVYACPSDGNALYCITKSGNILELKKDGAKIITNTSGKISYDIRINSKGIAFIHDLDSWQIYAAGKELTPVLPDEMLDEGLNNPAETIAYEPLADGSVAMAFSGGIIVVRDKAIIKSLTSLKYSTQIIFLRFAVWLVLAGLALLAFYGVWRALKAYRGKNSARTIVDAVMIILTVVFTTYIISGEVFRTMQKQYMNVIKNNLLQYSKHSALTINWDGLDSIDSIEAFDTEDYQKLKDDLLGLFRIFDEDTGCPYYIVLYKCEGSKLREVIDTTGSWARYQVIPDEKTAILTKIINTPAGMKDARTYLLDKSAGKWLFTAKPLYDSNGKLSGVLEVGRDLYSIEKTLKGLLKESILKTLSFLVIFILISIEALAFTNRTRQVKSKANPAVVRALSFLSFTAAIASSSIIPLLAANLNARWISVSVTEAMALPVAVEVLIMMLTSLYAPRMIERFGWKPQYMLGMGIIIAGSVCAVFSQSLEWLIMSRVICGIGAGLMYNVLTMISLLEKDADDRLLVQAQRNAGKKGGSLVGIFIGTLLLGSGFGLKAMMATVVIGIAAMAFAFILMPNSRPEKTSRENVSAIRGFFRAIFAKDASAFVFLVLIPSSMFIGSFSYIVSVLIHDLNAAPENLGRIVIAGGLITAWFSSVLTRYTLHKWGILFSSVAGCIILYSAMMILALYGSTAAAYITAALLGIAEAFALQASIEYFINTKQGKTLGYQTMGGYLIIITYSGMAAGAYIFGWLFSFGFAQGIWIMSAASSCLLALFSICHIVANRNLLILDTQKSDK